MQSSSKTVLFILLFIAGMNSLVMAQTDIDTIKPEVIEQSFVNIPFGNQPARIVTSAISTVKGEVLQKGFNTNLGNTLFDHTGYTAYPPQDCAR